MIKARKTVRMAKAYSPPLEGRKACVRLDFNENTSAATGYDQYPEYSKTLEKVARTYNIDPASLLLCNGSSEAIWMTAFSFIEPGQDTALTTSPTFSLIPQYLRLCGAEVVEIPVTADFSFDYLAIEQALYSGIKLVILASPDNPTGATLEANRLTSWLKQYPSTLFFIDEAYAEYGGADLLQLIPEADNLLVSRTFSKAWGLAGLRLGFVAGNRGLINTLNTVRIPYNVNAAALEILNAELTRRPDVERGARLLMQRKNSAAAAIEKRGYRVQNGAGNFLLMDAGADAAAIAEYLAGEKVLVRDRSQLPGMKGLIRVTIGSEAEMEQLFEALDFWKRTTALIFDLDDTLVDTSKSYDEAVMLLVEEFDGERPSREELLSLREEGGFNDDWIAAGELLRRRGITIGNEELRRRGAEIYLSLAMDFETLLLPVETLQRLAKRYRLFILTGRYRDEYQPVWGSQLDRLFEAVFCVDDDPGLSPKPAPDQLQAICKRFGLERAAYIGNSVDDMQAAAAAGMTAVGVCSTTSATILAGAGASRTIAGISQITEEFSL